MNSTAINCNHKYDSKESREIYNMCSLTDPRTNSDTLLEKLTVSNTYSNPISCNMNLFTTDNEYDRLMEKILKYGTISPTGPTEDTPSSIKLPLKPHQQRTLHEMIIREKSEYRLIGKNNILMLCDNVGSGKSIEILSLIAKNPIVESVWKNKYYLPGNISKYRKDKFTIQGFGYSKKIKIFSANLLIVPHNIYNQWINYIKTNTTLLYYGIGKKKDIIKDKESLYSKLMSINILCVKSTMFKEFIAKMNTIFGEPMLKTKSLNYSKDNGYTTKSVIVDSLSQLYKKFSSTFLSNPSKEVVTEYSNNFKNILENINYDDLSNSENIQVCDSEQRVKGIEYPNKDKTGYMFQRVIIDEVDSIRIPAFPHVYGKYTWFVTSSINNLLYPRGKYKYCSKEHKRFPLSNGIFGSGYLKETILEIVDIWNGYYSSSGYSGFNSLRVFKTIVRNHNDFIKDSIYIPPPNIKYIKCYTPPELIAVADAVSKDALKALNAGDTKTAIEILGCSSGTEDDILSIVNNKLYNEKKKIEETLKKKKKLYNECLISLSTIIGLLYDATNLENEGDINPVLVSELTEQKKQLRSSRDSYKTSIDTFTKNLSSVEDKIKGIEERVSGCDNKVCPICSCKVKDPSLTPCCKNVFCMSCIGMTLEYSKECPMCRAKLDIKTIKLIVKSSENKSTKDTKQLPTKLDVLINFINTNKKRRIMVFSEYDNTFLLLKNEFEKKDIKYSKLQGSSDRVSNIVDKFKNHEFQVLLLNAKNFGAGLNLQFTDNIFIFHRMNSDLENQVIGRAQRLGRSEPLSIHYMCYQNEYHKNTILENAEIIDIDTPNVIEGSNIVQAESELNEVVVNTG